MINFFRKIRQNLLVENKTGKYLKYAIGEIVLVVIGILIALQVNNWNLDRIAKKEARNYHERLIEELSSENLILKERLAYYILVQEHAKKVVAVLMNHPDSLGEEFIINAYQASQQWKYRNVRDTYDELISTGNIKLIPDQYLRQRIGGYYDETDVYLPVWYSETDYRELARRHIPFDVQSKIQKACEIWTDTDQQIGGNAIIQNCDPQLSQEEIDRTLSLLNQNNQLFNNVFLISANRQVSDLALKIGLYSRKLNGSKELIKLMKENRP
jgi:hypothetical protein